MVSGEENQPRSPTRLLSQLLLVAAIVAAVAGVVVLLLRQSSEGSAEVVLYEPTPPVAAEIRVYITGAVRNPGVYVATEGDRLAQLIDAAGGPVEDAALEAVNLAVRVRDEDHWHVPRVGEAAQTAVPASGTPAPRLDLNSATSDELEGLPGIGEVRAQSIIRFREANGPFPTVEHLVEVQGIGPATLDAIRDLVDAR